ncbi:MAG: hypothetical protein V1742_09330 [Pseudomonadota bacterium]
MDGPGAVLVRVKAAAQAVVRVQGEDKDWAAHWAGRLIQKNPERLTE